MGKRPSEHRNRVVRWRRRVRNVRRFLYALTATGLAAVIAHIPYQLLRPLSRALLAPLLQLSLGRTARRNLQIALGDELSPERQNAILREMFRGTASLLADWTGHLQHGRRYMERHVDDAEAKRKMREYERAGRGWIGLTGHIGNWELLGQWVHEYSGLGSGGNIAKRQPNPRLNRLIEKLRGRHGMVTLYREDPPGKVVRLLRRGKMVGIVPDQDVPSLAGVFIDFFGQPAYTPVGPARLALAANVPLVVAAMLRRGDRFELVVNDPIYPDLDRPRGEEIRRLTIAWSEQLEAIIRRHPEQWPWFHNRWKTTPEALEARNRRQLQL